MRSLSALFALLLLILGAGCASSELRQAARLANEEAVASGSPFRWETQEVNGNAVLRRYRWSVPKDYTIPYQLVPIVKPRDDLPVKFERIG